MPESQSYASHRRYHPLYHFFALPVLLLNVGVGLYYAFRRPIPITFWNALVSMALVVTVVLTRYYAIRVQNRLIRLEEQLRLGRLLPDDLRGRIGELHTDDLIGIRFCADPGVPDLVRAILAGECRGRDAIKRRIVEWRPDHHRV
jgi:hypothetical protein